MATWLLSCAVHLLSQRTLPMPAQTARLETLNTLEHMMTILLSCFHFLDTTLVQVLLLLNLIVPLCINLLIEVAVHPALHNLYQDRERDEPRPAAGHDTAQQGALPAVRWGSSVTDASPCHVPPPQLSRVRPAYACHPPLNVVSRASTLMCRMPAQALCPPTACPSDARMCMLPHAAHRSAPWRRRLRRQAPTEAAAAATALMLRPSRCVLLVPVIGFVACVNGMYVAM